MATKTVAPASTPRAPSRPKRTKNTADVVQPAEHLPSKQGVAGSIPAGRSNDPDAKRVESDSTQQRARRAAPGQEKIEQQGLDAICERLRAGESLTRIAKDIGVSIALMLSWIANDPERSARTREARSAAAAMYDEMALEAIESATDPLGLAKAREIAQHLRWRASATNPRQYGSKVAVGGDPDAPPVNHSMTVRFVEASSSSGGE